MMDVRVPPSSEEAEQTLLSCCLMSEAAAGAALARVEPADFYFPANRTLFAAMKRLHGKAPIHVGTLRVALKRFAEGDELAELSEYAVLVAGATPTAAGHKFFADRVLDLSRRRRLIAVAQDAIAKAHDPDATDIASGVLSAVLDLQMGEKGSRDWKRLNALMSENYARVEGANAALGQGKAPAIVTTGFPGVDDLAPLGEGDMGILAARTGFGKTVLGFQIAVHAATERLVGMFTLEMTDAQMTRRRVAADTMIPSSRQIEGRINEGEWDLLAGCIEKYRDHEVYLMDRPQITVAEMLAECRRLEAIAGQRMGLVVVDYLTLVSVNGLRLSDTERANQISRGLKLLAGELRCPVWALAQLNRGVDKREGQRPQLQDLKASGSLEQDASAVLFIHRDGHKDGQRLEDGPVEIIIAKSRHGRTGSTGLHWNSRTVQFGPPRATADIPIPAYARPGYDAG